MRRRRGSWCRGGGPGSGDGCRWLSP
ncbi:unnamed protein product [Spirodela intermedia]|uniref:Uncharacterized protein n=2 Tax=Spirodela intermedia TaxID=51605 RepID=A0A7I8JNN5_SPIIN|nr:unnamed protein product [Spirodela intermedia]CAA6671072.1 unnamed protein product [Spirodela intermedia]CAA7408180.1 unnamed protein product [Spirodela intermedia]